MERLTDAPKWIWAFEDEPGGVPKSGVWFEERSECPQGSPQYVRSDIVAKLQADLGEARMQSLADAGQAADALDRAVKAESDNAALRADVERLREALIAERIDNLENAYNAGYASDGKWSDMAMSDAEWLIREIGFDQKARQHDAKAVVAAIPAAAARFVAALGAS